MTLRRWILLLFLWGQCVSVLGIPTTQYSIDTELFPIPEDLVSNIEFWIQIFSAYSRNQAIIHDPQDLNIVYEVLNFNEMGADTVISYRYMRPGITQAKEKYRQILTKLAEKIPPDLTRLTPEERQVYLLFREPPTAERLRLAGNNIRVQMGLREEFLTAIVRSGKYIDEMIRIFRAYGIPVELTCLPHVESSFNYQSYSKVGAAGIWQFMRKTGRRFLIINDNIDERYDPLFATEAAAKFLANNYQLLGNWPLAITAYNHGAEGMARAKRMVGSDDFGEILKKYRSESFQFASRNFYAEFIAAVHVRVNFQVYFAEVELTPPLKYTYLEIPAPMNLADLIAKLDLNFEMIREFNPAFLRGALPATIELPKGFRLRLPETVEIDFADLYTNLPAPAKNPEPAPTATRKTEVRLPEPVSTAPKSSSRTVMTQVTRDRRGTSPGVPKYSLPGNLEPARRNLSDTLIVQPDETLGHLADWLEVPTATLRKVNRLRYGEDIQIGQKIKLAFTVVTASQFHARRNEYHQNKESEFFGRFQITGIKLHQLKRGENIWSLCKNTYEVPYWLLLKYNPNLDLERLKSGDEIIFPLVSISTSSNAPGTFPGS
ncbi:transglycosylase SLT domain-containing protein [candidate division KSB1 bacterium]|nr:transglycosylase SLT domain-containing protein [candidate division KSB1 bacterium]